MQAEVITVRNLSFKYNAVEVLSDISFSVNAGDYIGLVGPNGSGKSTLIKIILGLLNPPKGEVSLFGFNTFEMKDLVKVGYLPQKMGSFNPYFPSSVKEIVALGLISKKVFPRRLNKSDETAIDRALKLMNIHDIKDKLIGDLSGGQQQRALIARALVNEPELLILDEPATALDPETRENFYSLLHELNHGKKVTIVLVTHDFGTIGKYASKLLYLDKKIIFYSGFDDFCLSHDMRQFFGEASQHLICHRHD